MEQFDISRARTASRRLNTTKNFKKFPARMESFIGNRLRIAGSFDLFHKDQI